MSLNKNYDNLPEEIKRQILEHSPFSNAKLLALSLKNLDNIIYEAKLLKNMTKKNPSYAMTGQFPLYFLKNNGNIDKNNFKRKRHDINIQEMNLKQGAKTGFYGEISSSSKKRSSKKRSSKKRS